MNITIHDDKLKAAHAAALEGAEAICTALAANQKATIIVATGTSQLEMLEVLVRRDIDWSRVTAFHLDEYVGLGADHPASFCGYLEQRFVKPVKTLAEFMAIDGISGDLAGEVQRLNQRIADESIDLCFAGIGENCHLAFNDPPADFETTDPYIIVELDEACRRQQKNEGWFHTLSEVPDRAISMSISQIMKSGKLIITVPDARKAAAVAQAVEGPVTNMSPASIIQYHNNCSLHLDIDSAGNLTANRDKD